MHSNNETEYCHTKLLVIEISRRLNTGETFPFCLLFKNYNALLFIFNQKTSPLQQGKKRYLQREGEGRTLFTAHHL